jgi:EpsD family peptidyl-prolyl cis-trans isomerase
MAQATGFSTGQLMRQRIVITLFIALAATSCQKKASGQTVAVVNNEEITAAELNAEIAAESNNVTGGDTKQLRNAALQKLIDRKLVVQQARADGIDKSPEYLSQLRRSTDDLLINMLIGKRLGSSQVPTPQEISALEASRPEMFANRETWTLSQIIYPLPKDAALNAKLTAAKTLDEVAQDLTSAGVQFTRNTRKLDTAIFPHAIYAQIANLPAGEPFIAPGQDKAVASVITAREPNPTPTDQARAIALQVLRRDQVDKFVQDRVTALRASAKIQYQPGFGPSAQTK